MLIFLHPDPIMFSLVHPILFSPSSLLTSSTWSFSLSTNFISFHLFRFDAIHLNKQLLSTHLVSGTVLGAIANTQMTRIVP